MKKTVSILAMFFIIAAAASAQSIEKLFDKYQDDERFQYIYQNNLINSSVESNATRDEEKMLVLNEESFADEFANEIQKAIKSDKYINTSLVRHGKDRVEEYIRNTAKGGKNTITFIYSSGDITLIWNSYVPKKK